MRFATRRARRYDGLRCAVHEQAKFNNHDAESHPAIRLGQTLSVKAEKPARRRAELILSAREQVARAVNAGLTMLYWHVGVRIRKDILKKKRAEYGEEIVATLSRQLEREFGRGFAEKNLHRMVQFAEAFADEKIVATLWRQLGWSHFKEIIPIQDDLKRDFYAEMCRMEKWSVRMLRKKIGGMLYERTALSKKPDQLIRQELNQLRTNDRLTPDLVFRDPYILDFLGLKDTYAEKDLEAAILREIESFILEFGAGFCFVARQKRMQIDARKIITLTCSSTNANSDGSWPSI